MAATTVPRLHAAGSPGASLGGDIRALRKARGLTLSALALRIGRSVGFVSQVERGLSDPSLSDLRKLSAGLDVPLGFFFAHAAADPLEAGIVVRADRRRRLGNATDGLIEELLSPDLGGAFEVFRSEFEAGAELPDFLHRNTEEAGYVVSGRLVLHVGDRSFEVAEGDSFRFRNEPYRWRNPGDEVCVVIWTIAPPVY